MFLYPCNTCIILIHLKYLIDFFIFIHNFFTSNFESLICKITIKYITNIVWIVHNFTIVPLHLLHLFVINGLIVSQNFEGFFLRCWALHLCEKLSAMDLAFNLVTRFLLFLYCSHSNWVRPHLKYLFLPSGHKYTLKTSSRLVFKTGMKT